MNIIKAICLVSILFCTSTAHAECTEIYECAQEAVAAAKAAQDALRMSIPSGAVIAFDLDQCPAGWSEYSPAYGRFIRGIDKSESRIDPEGERHPGKLQEDKFKKHNHAIEVTEHSHGPTDLPRLAARGSKHDFKTKLDGDDETRPKNVALLYCRRN